MVNKPPVNIFWFRRDLRLEDNAGLFHALQTELPVVPVFIFDTTILEKLEDKNDKRVNFIYDTIKSLNIQLHKYQSSLVVKHGNPVEVWRELLSEFDIKEVFINNDYEPYARMRDKQISELLKEHSVELRSYKDHLIFEKAEILKSDLKPYTVFTPYKRKWLEMLNADLHLKSYPNHTCFHNFFKSVPLPYPLLTELGFEENSDLPIINNSYEILNEYSTLRDYPGVEGTSRIGIQLRFGTISIREAAREGLKSSAVWLSELIWRDFYSMILWYFPESANHAFKKEYENINWRNDEKDFEAWCDGRTGYPIVDAGMRQLNETGWMHNRVRMVVASFLTKHLLIDWRWGAGYFARKLLDFDLASNVGGWQWAAGTGNDAAPYFRIFNPELQTKRFDPELKYVRKWIPEFDDPFKYPRPIVEHKFARERAIRSYRESLSSQH